LQRVKKMLNTYKMRMKSAKTNHATWSVKMDNATKNVSKESVIASDLLDAK
jgi:hypothetical protein